MILKNNNAGKLVRNWRKTLKLSINNHNLIFYLNGFDLIWIIWFKINFLIFFSIRIHFFQNLFAFHIFLPFSIESKVINFEYTFVARFYTTFKNSMDDFLTTGYVVTALKKISKKENFKIVRVRKFISTFQKNQRIHFIWKKRKFSEYFMNNFCL